MMIANPVANADGYLHQTLPLDFSPKTRRPQTCRFDNTVFVVEIPSARTYSAAERQLCWYTNQDYRDFKVSMILERATMSVSHQRKPKNMNSQTQNSMVLDASPSLPRRSTSPDPDATRKALPANLPLYNDDCDESSSEACAMDVDEEDADEAMEHQIVKIKTMRAKLRRLRERQQQRKAQSSTSGNKRRSRPSRSFKNRYGERQSIDRADPLDISVRQYAPFPEDDDLECKTTKIPTTNVLPKNYEFEHPLFNVSAYRPTQSLAEAAEVIVGVNGSKKKGIDNILDSALSMMILH